MAYFAWLAWVFNLAKVFFQGSHNIKAHGKFPFSPYYLTLFSFATCRVYIKCPIALGMPVSQVAWQNIFKYDSILLILEALD